MKTVMKFYFVALIVVVIMVLTGLAFSDGEMKLNSQDPNNIACFDKWEASVNALNELVFLPKTNNYKFRDIYLLVSMHTDFRTIMQ